MQIVIDIPEARFRDIQRIADIQLEMCHFQTAEQIIAKGVPIEQEPKWIPISEKLPTPLTKTIVQNKGGFIYISRMVNGEWEDGEYSGEVIAWMPLPEQYEEESED